MPMLLNIQNIYKNYGKEPMIVPVLKDVSLVLCQDLRQLKYLFF